MKHYKLDARAVVALREEQGLTQTALAERVGISRSAMWQLENGHIQPSPATARAIADVLKVKFAEITEAAEAAS